jgi:Kef-type K+ transport system membrane component KefB
MALFLNQGHVFYLRFNNILLYMAEDKKNTETSPDQKCTPSVLQKIVNYGITIIAFLLVVRIFAWGLVQPLVSPSSYSQTAFTFSIIVLVFVIVVAILLRNVILHNEWCLIHKSKKDQVPPEVGAGEMSPEDISTIKKIAPPIFMGILFIIAGVALAGSDYVLGIALIAVGCIAGIIGVGIGIIRAMGSQ